VLTVCLITKEDYRVHVVPEVVGLKLHWFGHEAVVLHAHDIRTEKGDFRILFDWLICERVLDDLR
jgi:hypothetical protein